MDKLAGEIVAIGAIFVGFGFEHIFDFVGGFLFRASGPVADERREIHNTRALLDLGRGW